MVIPTDTGQFLPTQHHNSIHKTDQKLTKLMLTVIRHFIFMGHTLFYLNIIHTQIIFKPTGPHHTRHFSRRKLTIINRRTNRRFRASGVFGFQTDSFIGTDQQIVNYNN